MCSWFVMRHVGRRTLYLWGLGISKDNRLFDSPLPAVNHALSHVLHLLPIFHRTALIPPFTLETALIEKVLTSWRSSVLHSCYCGVYGNTFASSTCHWLCFGCTSHAIRIYLRPYCRPSLLLSSL